MTTLKEVRIKPNQGAINRALACAILSEVPHISLHTREALRSVSRRLLDGEPVSHMSGRSWFTPTLL